MLKIHNQYAILPARNSIYMYRQAIEKSKQNLRCTHTGHNIHTADDVFYAYCLHMPLTVRMIYRPRHTNT